MTCNATLTTAVVEDGELIGLQKLTCNRNTPYVGISGHYHRHARTDNEPWFAEWGDDTPGATPHTPPLVTDKEWSAALAVYFVGPDAWRHHERQMRAALEAAARVRQDTP